MCAVNVRRCSLSPLLKLAAVDECCVLRKLKPLKLPAVEVMLYSAPRVERAFSFSQLY